MLLYLSLPITFFKTTELKMSFNNLEPKNKTNIPLCYVQYVFFLFW